MNAIISKIIGYFKNTIKAITGIGVKGLITYGVHVLYVFLAAVALHFGFHISVPVLPTALASMTGLGALKFLFNEVSKSVHLGRLEAEAEKAAENYIENIFGPIIKHIAGQPAVAGADAPKAGHDGAYL